MSTVPLAINASAVERHNLRVKLFAYYGIDPGKSGRDIFEVCEWCLENQEERLPQLNEKLKKKYGKELSEVTEKSFADLNIFSQLKMFYAEMEPQRTVQEVQQVADWIEMNSYETANELMLKKYGENLSTFSFGGQKRLRQLLRQFYEKHDTSKLEEDSFQAIYEYALVNGAGRLNAKLLAKYGDYIHLANDGTEDDIEEQVGNAGEEGRSRAESDLPTPDSWRKSQQGKRLSLVKPKKGSNGKEGEEGEGEGGDETPDREDLSRLVELFYAKYSPQKLVSGTEDIVRFGLESGVEKLNEALRAKYDGKDLTTIESEYERLYDSLEEYFKTHNPGKLEHGFDDIAAWGVVHSAESLSERLNSKYGEPLTLVARDGSAGGKISKQGSQNSEFGSSSRSSSPAPEPEPLGSNSGKGMKAEAAASAAKAKANTSKSSHKVSKGEEEKADDGPKEDSQSSSQEGDELEGITKAMDRLHSVVLTGEFTQLSEKLHKFYAKHDPEKLNDAKTMDQIIKYAFKNGVETLNKKLKAKWGESLEDVEVSQSSAAAAEKKEDHGLAV